MHPCSLCFFAVHFELQIMLTLNWSPLCGTHLWNTLLVWQINNFIYSMNTKCLLLVILSNNIQPTRASGLLSFWQWISVHKDWTCWLMMWLSRVHDRAFPLRTCLPLWSGLTQKYWVPGRNFQKHMLDQQTANKQNYSSKNHSSKPPFCLWCCAQMD